MGRERAGERDQRIAYEGGKNQEFGGLMGAKRRKYFLKEGKISLVRWTKVIANKLLELTI